MDQRTSIRAIRALADGKEAFWSALETAPDFDADAFARFVLRGKLVPWVAPALEDDRARRLLPADLLGEVASQWEACRRRNAALVEASKRARGALVEAAIECLFLKGLYFGQRFYGDIDRRHQFDVDVLVRPGEFEAALGALARTGFDVETDLESGTPMSERLRVIRGPLRSRTPHAVEVRLGEAKLDLHWCLRARSVSRMEEGTLWSAREEFTLEGSSFETLSDDHALMFLLLSLCTDVKRGASRTKSFLDLYLLLRELEPQLEWEAFFARRAQEGLLGVCVNVLALFLVLWGCGPEFPGLVSALERRRRQIELADEAEALALVERPRGNRENRIWRRRIYPRSRWHQRLLRISLDLPHTLSRLRPSRRFSGRFAPPDA